MRERMPLRMWEGLALSGGIGRKVVSREEFNLYFWENKYCNSA